ncbi:unnamed protein product, partial [marine sediment metagenome]
MSCVPVFDLDGSDSTDFDTAASDLSHNDRIKSGTGIDYFTNFDDFMFAIKSGMLKGPFLGGFDVGRSQDSSEVVFIEEDPKTRMQIVRCNITFKNTRFPEQRSEVTKMVNALDGILIKFGIDNNGIGMNIAEDIEDISYELVEKLPFNNNAWKEEACRRFRYRMEYNENDTKAINLPLDRQLLSHIHSIKRILLPGGQWRFDASKGEKHHGDKYWATVAASEMGHPIIEGERLSSFDSRIGKDMSKGKSKKSIDIAVPELNNVMRFNPWGTVPGIGFHNIPAPNMSSAIVLLHARKGKNCGIVSLLKYI